MIDMLNKEEWRKQHPRLHGTKYNTYVRKWEETHKTADKPRVEVKEVKKMGLIESILDLPQPQKIVGQIDEELMMARTAQANYKAKAVDLCAKAKGGENGVVGEDVLNEALALCADVLQENKRLLKLAAKVYETAKNDIVNKSSAPVEKPKVKTGKERLMEEATEE